MPTTNDSDDLALTLGANSDVTRLEVLRALAWVAPLTADQLRRMVAPAMLTDNFRRRVLARLVAANLIESFYHYIPGSARIGNRRLPQRVGRIWSLTKAGFATVAADDKAPRAPAIVRETVVRHDLVLSEVVTRIIEWTRPILSSIYIEQEERLDTQRRRPIADAMLVVRYDPNGILPGIIPWKSMLPTPDEHARLYAIEIDRGTEEYRVTDEKAVNYRRVRSDPTFYERYGRGFPMVLITVPTTARLQRWHAGWKERWPDGAWLITTEASLARDEWFAHDRGQERLRTFVDGWQPSQGGRLATPLPTAGTTGTAHAAAAEQPPPVARSRWETLITDAKNGGGSQRPT
jgi:hypothetical protein